MITKPPEKRIDELNAELNLVIGQRDGARDDAERLTKAFEFAESSREHWAKLVIKKETELCQLRAELAEALNKAIAFYHPNSRRLFSEMLRDSLSIDGLAFDGAAFVAGKEQE